MNKVIYLILLILIWIIGIINLNADENVLDKARFYSKISEEYFNKCDYQNAYNYELIALEFWRDSGEMKSFVNSYYNVGRMKWYLSDYKGALNIFLDLQKRYIYFLDNNRITTLNCSIGICFFRIGDYKNAIINYMKSSRSALLRGDERSLSIVYNDLGFLFISLKDYTRAHYYLGKSLYLTKKLKLKRGESEATNNLAILYTEQKKWLEAKKYLNHSLTILGELNNERGIGISYCNLAEYYTNRDSLVLANKYYEIALEKFLKMKNYFAVATIYKDISKIYSFKNDYEKALHFVEISNDYGDKTKSNKILLEILAQYYNIYSSTGNYLAAYNYYKKYSALKDSIFSIENLNSIFAAEMEYRSLEYDNEYQKLCSTCYLLEEEILKKRRNKISYFISILFILTISFFKINEMKEIESEDQIESRKIEFLKNREKKLSIKRDELIVKNRLLKCGRFADLSYVEPENIDSGQNKMSCTKKWNSIHESSYGIAEKLNENLEVLDVKLEKYRNYLIRAGDNDSDSFESILNKLHSLVDRILSIKLNLVSEFSKCNLNKLVENFVSFISIYLKENNLSLKVNLSSDIPFLQCQSNAIEDMLLNLFINSCQAIKSDGQITISTSVSDNNVYLSLEDNGKGISEEDKDKIWLSFFTTKTTGKGLGLAWVKRIVKAHNSEISIESKLHVGTRVEVKFRRAYV